MTVTYHYWQYHHQCSEDIATLHEALHRARTDVEYERAAPEKIVLEDGTELDHEEVMERSGYYADVSGLIIDSTAQEVTMLDNSAEETITPSEWDWSQMPAQQLQEILQDLVEGKNTYHISAKGAANLRSYLNRVSERQDTRS